MENSYPFGFPAFSLLPPPPSSSSSSTTTSIVFPSNPLPLPSPTSSSKLPTTTTTTTTMSIMENSCPVHLASNPLPPPPPRRPTSSSSRRQKRKHVAWTEQEKALFVLGLRKFGHCWKHISECYVKTKTSKQVASHGYYYMKQYQGEIRFASSSSSSRQPPVPSCNFSTFEHALSGSGLFHQQLQPPMSHNDNNINNNNAVAADVTVDATTVGVADAAVAGGGDHQLVMTTTKEPIVEEEEEEEVEEYIDWEKFPNMFD